MLEFSKHNGRKDGLSDRCKQCDRERVKARTPGQRQEEKRKKAEKLGKEYRTAEELKVFRSEQRAAKKEAEKIRKAKARAKAKTKKDENRKPWQKENISSADKYRLRYRLDPEYNIKERLRRQLNKQKKKDKYADLMRAAINKDRRSPLVTKTFGYSIKELKKHLENQFTDGMTWKAFMSGKIHIDHIKPIAAHDLTNQEEFLSCWALSNLQPLWARDNLVKSATWAEAA